MLYGRYQHNIDAKGRIFVPAKLREKLGDAFIAAAVMDHCVCLYSMEEWDKLMEGLAASPMTQSRKLLRVLSANAQDVQVDAQGRILLPKQGGAGARGGQPGGNLEPRGVREGRGRHGRRRGGGRVRQPWLLTWNTHTFE